MFIFPNLAKTIDFIIKICTISSHHPSRNQQQRKTKILPKRQQGPPPYRYTISPTNIPRQGDDHLLCQVCFSLQPSCSSSCPVWYQHCTVLPVSALSCLLPLCCSPQKLHHCGHVGCTARQPPRPPASAAQPLTSTKDARSFSSCIPDGRPNNLDKMTIRV